MLRLALAQMRRSPGRLAAGGVAIALGSAFVAVTLLAGDVMTRTAYSAVTASYAEADIVVNGWGLTEQDIPGLQDVAGVTSAEARPSTFVEITGDAGALWLQVDAPAQNPALEARVLLDGTVPGPDEIALPDGAASSLGLTLGDTATVTVSRATEDSDQLEVDTTALTVVGIVDDAAAGLIGSPVALADRDQVLEWAGFQTPDEPPVFETALVTLADDVDVQDVKAALHRSLKLSNPLAGEITVRTIDEEAEWRIADLTSETRMLTTIGLGFAAIALLVAALVIANTFQVLVAQRTRTLALLRCVGADRSQLRRSVLIEAGLLGVIAATGGLLLGIGLVQGALLILHRTMPNVPLPTMATVTWWSVLVPLVVGVVVTVIASLAPARAATRVSPLAAMRPADAPRFADRGGRLRAWFSGSLVVLGAAVMAVGIDQGGSSGVASGLGLGVLGGAVSFLGILLSAVFWAPRLVGLVARLVGRNATTRLAGANSLRNPRRTSATSTALLIGVTLVVMMATGAASARQALDDRLDQQYPVDVEARAMDDLGWFGKLPDTLASTFEETAGVADVVRLTGGAVDLTMPNGDVWGAVEAIGADAAAAREVLHSEEQLAGLEATTVVVPADLAEWADLHDGDTLTLAATTGALLDRSQGDAAVDDGTVDSAPAVGGPVDLMVVVTRLPGNQVVVTRDALASVIGPTPDSVLWVRLAEHADAGEVVAELQTAASRSTTSTVQVVGAATERAAYQEVIGTLLAIIIGLLAVSVVIALVGVANTLSLSVIERRRESATLRAIGLSKRQLRGSLAAEGMIIAGVGGVVGAVIGTAYGWVGARTVLNQIGPTPFAVAWREVAVVIVVAVAAGLAASVLPARSAVRTSPVEALAVE
jgi:putative ABC transport system permease protein